jgi:hypothetical protein
MPGTKTTVLSAVVSTETPGPAAYLRSSTFGKETAQHSLASSLEHGSIYCKLFVSEAPGPGKLFPKLSATFPQPPRILLNARPQSIFDGRTEAVPAACTYDPTFADRSRAPAFTLRERTSMSSATTMTPAPNSTSAAALTQLGQTRLAVSLAPKMRDETEFAPRTPGPAAYGAVPAQTTRPRAASAGLGYGDRTKVINQVRYASSCVADMLMIVVIVQYAVEYPAPGTYRTDVSPVRTRAPRAVMSARPSPKMVVLMDDVALL